MPRKPVPPAAPPATPTPPSAGTRVYGGVDADERRQQRLQRFMEAGVELFGTRGLAHTTMRDLCSHARLTDRYFYESFKRVEDVFDAVYADLNHRLVEQLQQAMSGMQPQMDTMAEAGLRAFFAFMREDPRRVRIMLLDVLATRQEAEPARDHPSDAYVQLLAGLYQAMYPQARDIQVDIDFVINALIGMTIHSAVVWARAGFDKSIDEVVRHNLFAWYGVDTWVRRELEQAGRRQAPAQPRETARSRIRQRAS